MLSIQPAQTGTFANLPRYPAPDLSPAASSAASPAAPSGSGLEAAPASPPAEKPSEQSTREAVGKLNEALQQINTGLEFSQDEDTGWTVVKLIDRETKETIRQYPSEEAIAIAHSLDKMKGVLLRQTA